MNYDLIGAYDIKLNDRLVYVSLLVIDETPKARTNAIAFFEELSRRGTVLLNNMADIISKLHHRQTPLPKIKQILAFLIKLISGNQIHLGKFIQSLCYWYIK